MTPRATYRFQFHRDFPFSRAEALVPYLEKLGISHVYASPVTMAVSGSTHGYDVVDPTRINPELGGEDALRSLVAALRARGMGLIIDIVPNHMGVAGGENAWWTDVLRHGPQSQYANFFDIDWRKPLLLPILGAPLPDVLAERQIEVIDVEREPHLSVYDEHILPLKPGSLEDADHASDLGALLERQHYQLAWWRAADDEINWRRFFTINDLAGLRVEDVEVFEATHALYFRLWQEGMIDGVRIDHVDGLSDPADYLERLRKRFDSLPREAGAPAGPAYIVVEKILGAGERLPAGWPVEGTSGYDFMDEVSAVLHDPVGEEPLTELWRDFSGRSGVFEAEELRARRQLLDWAFQAQLTACVKAFGELAASAQETAGWTEGMLRRAIERLLWVFPAYRTYGTGRYSPPEDAELREAVRKAVMPHVRPGEQDMADMVLRWLAGDGPGDDGLAFEAVRKFQQLSAPIAAKAVEDTAFYRNGTLLSRVDVGFDPRRFALSPADFLATAASRGAHHPHAMLATATHDHKRGEDVRARLSVLSQIPDEWEKAVRSWDAVVDGPKSGVAPADRLMAFQTLFGAWPEGLAPDDADGLAAFAERLDQWQGKAVREAKLRSSWNQPEEGYEARCSTFITRLCQPNSPLTASVGAFVEATSAATSVAMLGQVAMRCLLPGVPDCYQGCELPDFSLVDPDNRRPVDYDLRIAMAESTAAEHPKMAVLRAALAIRQEAPELFASGNLSAATVTGARADHIVAFSRHQQGKLFNCAILLRMGQPLHGKAGIADLGDWWGDTRITFANGDQTPRDATGLFAGSTVFMELL